MMIKVVFILVLLSHSSYCQNAFTGIITSLEKNSRTRDSVWSYLMKSHRIPLIEKDSAAFLYRGEASSVKWMGDFNGWGYDKNFQNQGKKIPGSDIWILKSSFPQDARFDYKIILDEKFSILDPANPNQQWSGLGGGSPNSELRMPQWKRDPAAIPDPSVTKGHLSKEILLNSKILGYQITYTLYEPNPAPSGTTPILYVTDGYEYLHTEMGNMTTILDNLIATKKINPIRVVFVDSREPANRGNNRRMQELALNENYLRFFVEELIPSVEKGSGVAPENRGIMGTSMGGLCAAFFAFSRPDVFGLAGIQSPAFWFRPEIYTVCDNPEKQPVKIFMTTGTVNDAEEGAEKMKKILEKNVCTFQYKEVPQGHSWGNWKDLIDDILIYFFAPK
jgi:enterochelin esterase-like enzyme